MPRGHHPCGPILYHAEITASRNSAVPGRQPHPHRHFSTAVAMAASTAALGDEQNAAHTPSPVCLNMNPPCVSIAERNTFVLCAASATHIRVGLPPTGRPLSR